MGEREYGMSDWVFPALRASQPSFQAAFHVSTNESSLAAARRRCHRPNALPIHTAARTTRLGDSRLTMAVGRHPAIELYQCSTMARVPICERVRPEEKRGILIGGGL